VAINSDRQQLINQLFAEALNLARDERESFLSKACGDDEKLLHEVQSLVENHEAAEQKGFLQQPNLLVDTANSISADSEVAIPNERENETAPRIDHLLAPRYDQFEAIGAGAMGWVYRARHKTLDVERAIKVIRPDCSSVRFEREARLMAQISSQHVVRVHDFEVHDGLPILVMEWIDGTNLSETLAAHGGRLTEEDALPWMRQTCEGMQAAANKGIIHRDLKPSNIMIDGRGQARVTDFGLARGPIGSGHLSLTNKVMGTPYYMAPEQAENPSGVDTRADVYSFGATFYHALTGTPPFQGETAFTILFKHKTEPLISPKARHSAISDQTNEVLERCLAKSPSDRFQSFAELRKYLQPAAPSVSPWDEFDDSELAEYLSTYNALRREYLQRTRATDKPDVYSFPNGRELRITVGDIVEQEVDAIVSSDDTFLTMDGGVSRAISMAAGQKVASEVKLYTPVRPGHVVVTSGGNLKSRFIFHGVTIGFKAKRPGKLKLKQSEIQLPSRDIISEVLASCFYHADALYVSSIAIPLLGTGAGGFSEDVCLDATFRFLARKFLRGVTSVQKATIVLLSSLGSQQTGSQSRKLKGPLVDAKGEHAADGPVTASRGIDSFDAEHIDDVLFVRFAGGPDIDENK